LGMGSSHHHLLVLSDVSLKRLNPQVISWRTILLQTQTDEMHIQPAGFAVSAILGLYNRRASNKGMGRCS
jgi:hypothetical protein